jgi:hypothetical protein
MWCILGSMFELKLGCEEAIIRKLNTRQRKTARMPTRIK